MVRLVSNLIYDSIDYTNIQRYLESKLKYNKRWDSRLFLDYRKPNVAISQLNLQAKSISDILSSSITLTAGLNRLGVRIYVSINYSKQKFPIVTNVEFNKLDEDEIADIDGHNLNYGYWIGSIVENMLKNLIGDQLEDNIPFEDRIITCYWSLKVVICFDTYDGNGIDWSVLGTNIALKHINIPCISVNNDGKFIINEDNSIKKQLIIPYPIFCITFCRIDQYLLIDPTLLEESHGTNFTIVYSPNTDSYQLIYYNNRDLGNYNLNQNELNAVQLATNLLSSEINF